MSFFQQWEKAANNNNNKNEQKRGFWSITKRGKYIYMRSSSMISWRWGFIKRVGSQRDRASKDFRRGRSVLWVQHWRKMVWCKVESQDIWIWRVAWSTLSLGILTPRTPSVKLALIWSWVIDSGTAIERVNVPKLLSETYSSPKSKRE